MQNVFKPGPFLPNQKGFASYMYPKSQAQKVKRDKSLGPNVYTQAAIAARDAEIILWCAVIAAGAFSLLPGVQPQELIPHDRNRDWIRNAVRMFPTPEIRAAERAYQRAAGLAIQQNMGMVYQVAGRLERKAARYGLEKEDLTQEGMIGLQRALETFDPDRGLAFSTYAHWWVYQCINRAISNSGLIRVPVHARAAADAELTGGPAPKNGKRPRSGTLERVRNAERLSSIDAPMTRTTATGLGVDGEYTLGDLLVDPEGVSPADAVAAIEDAEQLTEVMTSLSAKERRVLEVRFWEDRTLEEVGEELGLTRERIRQIEKSCLAKLYKILERRGVR